MTGKSRVRQEKKRRVAARVRQFFRWCQDHGDVLTYDQWCHEHMRKRAVLS